MVAVITDDPEEHHTEPVEALILHDEPEEVEERDHIDQSVVISQEGQVDSAVPHHAEDVVTGESEPEDHEHELELPDSPSPSKLHGDDLADLVSMLEAKKPISEDLIAGEIPDDEE